uniref:Uncharacterized protein n=1 Tax=Anguilla anguilla TaxID=7936 RepID=A0A0E9QWD9_ANGAN
MQPRNSRTREQKLAYRDKQ